MPPSQPHPYLIHWLILAMIMAVWMKGWWPAGIPFTPRQENIPQLVNMWRLSHNARARVLWASWNPTTNTGAPNLIQRSYIIFAPLAQVASSLQVSPDWIYKFAVWSVFTFSAIGMYQLLGVFSLKSWPRLLGALSYMLSPPHLTLGSDLLDFNLYWTILPWIVFIIERYFRLTRLFFHAAVLGGLLTLGFFSGTTYFVATMPFVGLYVFTRAFLSRYPLSQLLHFAIISLVMFISSSAFISLPALIEYPYTWLSQETARRQTIDLPQPINLVKLFPLRWQGYPALGWQFAGRYPDLGWYFGTVSLVLSSFGLLSRRPWKQKLPVLILTLALVPFFLITKVAWLKFVALKLLSLWPGLQASFDHTFRLFILPVFSLSLFSAFGSEAILHRIRRHPVLIAVSITMLLLIDFLPLSQFFFSIPHQDRGLDQSILRVLNAQPESGRFWSPFPYRRTLPPYGLEYLTHDITRPRVNSEFFYTALAPRYASEIYETRLIGALETDSVPVEKISRLLNWANTRYILLSKRAHWRESQLKDFVTQGWRVAVSSDASLLLETPQPPGFIHTFTRFSSVPLNHADDFDYWYDHSQNQGLYFGPSQPSLSEAINPPAPVNLVRQTRTSPQIISTQVDTPAPTLVVASESWYPGWSVSVDGQNYPLVRANYAFLGVITPPGNHQIVFSYDSPWYYSLGLAISGGSLSLICLIVAGRRLKFLQS